VLGVLDAVAVAALLTAPTKLLSGFYGGRLYDLNTRRSLRVGLAMVTRGEFSLIIASAPLTATVLSGSGGPLTAQTAETIYTFTVGYVLVMSLLGTTLMQVSPVFERYLPSVTAE
jgi:CPA2 family monovalent cation:H+ antiporter-2